MPILPESRVPAHPGEVRGVTPESARLLAQALGTTPELGTSLQTAHDLAAARPKRTIEPLRPPE